MKRLKSSRVVLFALLVATVGLFLMGSNRTVEAACNSGRPSPGCEEWIDGPTYQAAANYNECSTDIVPWQLDNGYVLVGYKDHRLHEDGRVTMSVSYIQAQGHSRATVQDTSRFNQAINAAYQEGFESYAGSIEDRKEQYRQAIAESSSSHAKVEVHVKACGDGNLFDQTGGRVKGVLRLKVRYIGTPQSIQNEANLYLSRIQEAVEGRQVYFWNNCHAPLKLALRYREPDGDWVTRGWWHVDGSDHSYLASGGTRIRSVNSGFYYYAESTDGSNLRWAGSEYRNLGSQRLGMRYAKLTPDSDGDFSLRLSCSR